jgi:hypothetical protein
MSQTKNSLSESGFEEVFGMRGIACFLRARARVDHIVVSYSRNMYFLDYYIRVLRIGGLF